MINSNSIVETKRSEAQSLLTTKRQQAQAKSSSFSSALEDAMSQTSVQATTARTNSSAAVQTGTSGVSSATETIQTGTAGVSATTDTVASSDIYTGTAGVNLTGNATTATTANTSATTSSTADSSSGMDFNSLADTMMELAMSNMRMNSLSMLTSGTSGSSGSSNGMGDMMSMLMMVVMLKQFSNMSTDSTQNTTSTQQTAGVGTGEDSAVATNWDYNAVKSTVTTEYEDIIESAAQKYNISSALLKGVIQAESSWNPNNLSSAGAKGLMQLMPETAAEVGVTDPYDPAQNIEGATHYIAKMINRFDGDITLALAAYNTGPNRVSRLGVISSSDANYQNVPKAARDYATKVQNYANYYATGQR